MKRIIPLLLCILFLAQCKKEDSPEPETLEIPAPTPTGDLSGNVKHYNQFGALYTAGLNTTTVSIEGKNFTTVTDNAGHYTISGVPSNTYTLVFKKPGCGLIKLQDIIYNAGDTTKYTADVADIPAFALSSAYTKDTLWFSGTLGGIYFNANSNPPDSNASIIAIVGKTPNIDLADPSSYLNYPTTTLIDSLDFKRFFSYSLLKYTYNFKKDSILYLKVYPVATKGSFYFDNKSKTPVYTAYGAAYPTVFSLFVH